MVSRVSTAISKPSSKSVQIKLGWREWVSLPGLDIPFIKAKVDTGARTSALHTFAIETYHQSGKLMVGFDIHPLQKRDDIVRHCVAEVFDQRWVTDSGGHREQRYVIKTPVILAGKKRSIEITLTSRDNMQFRMLLGRTAMRKRFSVIPGSSYLLGKPDEQELDNSYRILDETT